MEYHFGKYPHPRWYHRLLGIQPKHAIHCRVDYWDVWSLDYTLSNVIVPALKRLREDSIGCPLVDDEDLPEYLHIPEGQIEDDVPGNAKDMDLMIRRWHYVLDYMIWAFEQDLIDWEDQYIQGTVDLEFKDDGTIETQTSKDYHLDEEGLRNHYDKILHGRYLFAKYYNALWF